MDVLVGVSRFWGTQVDSREVNISVEAVRGLLQCTKAPTALLKKLSWDCLSYFSFVVIRHHEQATYKRKYVLGTYRSRGLESLTIMGRRVAVGRLSWPWAAAETTTRQREVTGGD